MFQDLCGLFGVGGADVEVAAQIILVDAGVEIGDAVRAKDVVGAKEGGEGGLVGHCAASVRDLQGRVQRIGAARKPVRDVRRGRG